jgi:FkbM family methyltransferase
MRNLARGWWRHQAGILPRSIALFQVLAILRLSPIGRLMVKTELGARVFTNLRRRTRPESGEIYISVGRMKFVIDVNDTVGVGGSLLEGEFEPVQTALISRNLKPGMTFIDIGANIGYYTVIASKRVGKSGRVYCFEPDPQNYRMLVKNISENKLSNVCPQSTALSDSTGTATLHTDSKNFGAHSLNKSNIWDEKSEVTVSTMKLDDFVGADKIDMIKLDVQGAESKVIAGSIRTLMTQRPILVLELWPYGIQKMGDDPVKLVRDLEEIGYHIQVTEDYRKNKIVGSVEDSITDMVSSKNSYLNLFLSADGQIEQERNADRQRRDYFSV